MEDLHDGADGDVTQLLVRARDGDREALDGILPLVYAELRRLARLQLRHERNHHTLGVSGLVNEAYMKLIDQARVDWQGRKHFYAVASRAMRQVLVDYARKRNAQKRGAGHDHTTIENKQLGLQTPLEKILDLEQALERLDTVDSRLRQLVEYRFFGGLSEEETADLLELSPRTVQREWAKARAWLYRELY
jgi:RNA polymerase sigma factor (TIGR02999 family)